MTSPKLFGRASVSPHKPPCLPLPPPQLGGDGDKGTKVLPAGGDRTTPEIFPSVPAGMFTKKPYDSAYGPPPTSYGPPTGDYGYDFTARSPPPGSYYVEDVPQLFYKWSSPPGLVRLLEGAVMLLCVAVFACVASTLAWDYGYGYGYGGVLGTGLGGYYGSGYYGSGVNYGYGYGGYYGGVTNPRAANGFMIAMAVLCFLAQLGLLVASLSKSSGSRSRRFYLVVIVVSALLALVMLVASIVYVVGVNPQAQMSGGGYYYSPLLAMCSQVYAGGAVLNQYLYHYCTVDPQEVKNVSGGASVPDEAATIAYSEKGGTPGPAPPYSPPLYSDPPQKGWNSDPPSDPPSPSEEPDAPHPPLKPPARRGRRGRRQPEGSQGSQGDTDPATAAESGDSDSEQWHRLYPPVGSPGTRQRYKAEFGQELRRYKELCAHMDGLNERLAQLAAQLDQVPEDSAQYQALAEEYNHLKDVKRSPEYQDKKRESKTLRNKLFHIKRMVSDYDKLRA
ncbi:occludin isoform X2 [Haemorhous mexicanus]|uniref:occludin isoform X2 n=1 Tax=Haemorhous mexicanus TaxID=30427 RepID=UPI0028BE814C|nr:occludin isoform X2 [Haemorhous mexicanus]